MAFTLGTLYDYGIKKPAGKLMEGMQKTYEGAKESAGNVVDYFDRAAMINDLEKEGEAAKHEAGFLDDKTKESFKTSVDSGDLKKKYLAQVGKSYKDEAAALAAYEASQKGVEGNMLQQLDAEALNPEAATQLDKSVERADKKSALEEQQKEQEGKWSKFLEDVGRLSELQPKKKTNSNFRVSSQSLSGAGRLGTGLSLKDILKYRP